MYTPRVHSFKVGMDGMLLELTDCMMGYSLLNEMMFIHFVEQSVDRCDGCMVCNPVNE